MHISPYKAELEVPPQLQVHIDTTVSVGTFVAVLDDSNDKRYHIAKVQDIGERLTQLHYHATKSRKLRNALWRPVYEQPHTNRYVMAAPDTIHRDDMKYIGTIDTRPPEDSLIILANVGMTNRMKVDARSREILRKMNGYSHHRLTQTWNP